MSPEELRPDERIAALEHARAFLLQEADQRSRNFNFFLAGLAVVFVGVTNTDEFWIRRSLFVAGAILAAAFWIIDKRNFMLLKDARRQLYRLEPCFGLDLHERDELTDEAAGIATNARSRLISTTVAYRSILVSAFVGCILGTFLAPPPVPSGVDNDPGTTADVVQVRKQPASIGAPQVEAKSLERVTSKSAAQQGVEPDVE